MFETPSVLKTKLIYVLGRTDAWCAISEWDFKLNHLNRADGWIAISEWDFILNLNVQSHQDTRLNMAQTNTVSSMLNSGKSKWVLEMEVSLLFAK